MRNERWLLACAGTLTSILFSYAPFSIVAETAPEPIIDVHFHALRAAELGKPPLAICAPFDAWPVWDPKSGPEALEKLSERLPGLVKKTQGSHFFSTWR